MTVNFKFGTEPQDPGYTRKHQTLGNPGMNIRMIIEELKISFTNNGIKMGLPHSAPQASHQRASMYPRQVILVNPPRTATFIKMGDVSPPLKTRRSREIKALEQRVAERRKKKNQRGQLRTVTKLINPIMVLLTIKIILIIVHRLHMIVTTHSIRTVLMTARNIKGVSILRLLTQKRTQVSTRNIPQASKAKVRLIHALLKKTSQVKNPISKKAKESLGSRRAAKRAKYASVKGLIVITTPSKIQSIRNDMERAVKTSLLAHVLIEGSKLQEFTTERYLDIPYKAYHVVVVSTKVLIVTSTMISVIWDKIIEAMRERAVVAVLELYMESPSWVYPCMSCRKGWILPSPQIPRT